MVFILKLSICTIHTVHSYKVSYWPLDIHAICPQKYYYQIINVCISFISLSSSTLWTFFPTVLNHLLSFWLELASGWICKPNNGKVKRPWFQVSTYMQLSDPERLQTPKHSLRIPRAVQRVRLWSVPSPVVKQANLDTAAVCSWRQLEITMSDRISYQRQGSTVVCKQHAISETLTQWHKQHQARPALKIARKTLCIQPCPSKIRIESTVEDHHNCPSSTALSD